MATRKEDVEVVATALGHFGTLREPGEKFFVPADTYESTWFARTDGGKLKPRPKDAPVPERLSPDFKAAEAPEEVPAPKGVETHGLPHEPVDPRLVPNPGFTGPSAETSEVGGHAGGARTDNPKRRTGLV